MDTKATVAIETREGSSVVNYQKQAEHSKTGVSSEQKESLAEYIEDAYLKIHQECDAIDLNILHAEDDVLNMDRMAILMRRHELELSELQHAQVHHV